MTKRKTDRNPIASICEPVSVYVLTRRGIERPPGATVANDWNDLHDIGRKLALPHASGETLDAYAERLRRALEPLDRRQYVGGASVHMLRLTIDLCCSRSATRRPKPMKSANRR